MCGIAAVSEMRVLQAVETLRNRGIRTRIYHCEKAKINLVGRRLPIQGLSLEYDSPYTHEDSGKIILFSGEIYNYKEINRNAESDIEVLAEELSKSDDCFSKFDGMWSIILYDKEENRIIAYTDFLAKKPLYFTMNPFQVASEIKCLYSKQNYNLYVLSNILKFGYYFKDCETPFEGIYKLPPGSKLVYNIKTKSVGVFPVKSMQINKKEFSPSKLKNAIIHALKNRLVSDIPLSFLVSGGIDSSIIASILSKEAEDFRKIKAFHLINTKEEKYLRILEKEFNFRADKISAPEEKPEEALQYSDTPQDLGSLILQYQIGKAIRDQKFSVAISGDGADEILGGYSRLHLFDTQNSDIFDELVFYHLPRLDCMMLQNTVELRSPFLSKEVVELSLDVPYSERIDKKILRKIFENELPSEIIERGKTPLRVSMPEDKKLFYFERISLWQDLVERKWKF